jgi:hypothetical protein
MLAPIVIKSSRTLSLMTLLLYIGAEVALLLSTVAWYGQLLLTGLLIMQAQNYLRRHIWLRDHESVVALACSSSGLWSLQLANSALKFADLRPTSFVTHFLIILLFITEDQRRISVIITRNSIGFQPFRRLLIHLHHNRKKISQVSQKSKFFG